MTDLPDDFDADGNPSFRREAREALVKHLASEWSRIDAAMEKLHWRQAARYDEDHESEYEEHLAEVFEERCYAEEERLGRKLTEDERFDVQAQLDDEEEARSPMGRLNKQLDMVEAQLDVLGARMMRPYEHHGEDEGYYEYMERDRSYEY